MFESNKILAVEAAKTKGSFNHHGNAKKRTHQQLAIVLLDLGAAVFPSEAAAHSTQRISVVVRCPAQGLPYPSSSIFGRKWRSSQRTMTTAYSNAYA